jgi:hypothetical protein
MTAHRCRRLRWPAAASGWALGCLLLLAAVAGGAPAGSSLVVGAAAPATDPLEVYVRGLAADQQARVVPLFKAAGTNQQERQQVLQEALATLNPDLARARDALDADQPAEALPILAQLTASPDRFLATYAAWLRIRGLVAGERFEEALAILIPVQTNAAQYSLLAGDLLYTEGILRACLLERPAAKAVLLRYLQHYPGAPAERRASAQEVLNDIKRVNPVSLSEVVAQMNDARRRLQLQDCSDVTLARQAGIVTLFDQVIEKAEEKLSKSGKASKATGAGGEPKKGLPPGEKPGTKGAQESALSKGEAGKTDLAEPVSGQAPDDWAKAYARDREAVQRELQTRVPDRYRELIEQYYRSLSTGTEPAAEAGK